MKKLYRGIWAERLENNDKLLVGGSIFSDKLTTSLLLDFDSFSSQLESYKSPEKMSNAYEKSKQEVKEWLMKINSNIDPYLFFVSNQIQRKVQTLLEVNLKDSEERTHKRTMKYIENKNIKLSDLVGISKCGEQAAFGQYLLQNVLEGYNSAYMSGISCFALNELEDHSFIVLNKNQKDYLIFDIACPRSGNNLPRILKTDFPFLYELFEKQDNLVVGATEVLQGGRLYFGVGNPRNDSETRVLSLEK